MVKLGHASVMQERVLDVFQRLLSADEIASEAEEERRVRAETRAMAIAAIEARDKAKADARAAALAEERAVLKERREYDARVEARIDRLLSGVELSDADLGSIRLESIEALGAAAPAEPEARGG